MIGLILKIKEVLELSNIKIILYLYDRAARYSDLLKNVVESRSTLALTLKELQEEGLIDRKVKATRPVQTEYMLTDKGKRISEHLFKVKELIQII